MKKTSSGKEIVVLGATGLLGSAMLDSLRHAGLRAVGTTRKAKKNAKHLLSLDTTNESLVKKFPWKRFQTILDCTGTIDYGISPLSAQRNLKTNVLGPLRIIEALSESQRYFYCSTHAVLLPALLQNAYTLSKRAAEAFLASVSPGPRVVVLRLPGLFSETRKTGLLHKIKHHFQTKLPLSLEIATDRWHVMYLPRIVRQLTALLMSRRADLPGLLTFGYPIETSVTRILKAAEKEFPDSPKLRLRTYRTDHYFPKVDSLVAASSQDWTADLLAYFRAR